MILNHFFKAWKHIFFIKYKKLFLKLYLVSENLRENAKKEKKSGRKKIM